MHTELDEQWFSQMRGQYRATASDKLSELSSAIDLYLKDRSIKKSQLHLHKLLHNLIGSGGSYGFPEVSAAARDMSDLLKRSRAAGYAYKPQALRAELDALLERLKTAFGS